MKLQTLQGWAGKYSKKKSILVANLLQFSRPFLRLCVKGWIQWCLSTTVCDRLKWNSSCGLKSTPWAFDIEISSCSSSKNSSSGWSEVKGRCKNTAISYQHLSCTQSLNHVWLQQNLWNTTVFTLIKTLEKRWKQLPYCKLTLNIKFNGPY